MRLHRLQHYLAERLLFNKFIINCSSNDIDIINFNDNRKPFVPIVKDNTNVFTVGGVLSNQYSIFDIDLFDTKKTDETHSEITIFNKNTNCNMVYDY